MQIRYGRLGGLTALTAVILIPLAAGPLQAGQEVSVIEANAEDSLLGIHLISSTYRDVLKKYGQPNEIQAGGPFLPTPPPDVAAANKGGGMGGPMGGMGKGPMMGGPGGPMSGGMGGPMSGGPMGSGGMGGRGNGPKKPSKNGFPGKDSNGGGAGGMGGPMSGGPMGRGGPMSGGPMGGPGGPSSGGLPGFGPNSGGPMGGPGMGGPMSGGNEGPEAGTGTEEESNPPLKETTWWYHDPQKGTHISFVFNRVGQVIQIGEYAGYNPGKPSKGLERMKGVLVPARGASRRGVTLGMQMRDVIAHYGWSLSGAHDGENVIMRFGGSHRIAFQLVQNRILGITIGYVKSGNSITSASSEE